MASAQLERASAAVNSQQQEEEEEATGGPILIARLEVGIFPALLLS